MKLRRKAAKRRVEITTPSRLSLEKKAYRVANGHLTAVLEVQDDAVVGRTTAAATLILNEWRFQVLIAVAMIFPFTAGTSRPRRAARYHSRPTFFHHVRQVIDLFPKPEVVQHHGDDDQHQDSQTDDRSGEQVKIRRVIVFSDICRFDSLCSSCHRDGLASVAGKTGWAPTLRSRFRVWKSQALASVEAEVVTRIFLAPRALEPGLTSTDRNLHAGFEALGLQRQARTRSYVIWCLDAVLDAIIGAILRKAAVERTGRTLNGRVFEKRTWGHRGQVVASLKRRQGCYTQRSRWSHGL